ncbi:hypothetical protein [Streptomyces sp. BBFR109]|uniref:hypothetical protein n=1 Tax=Streptomyces sp. BBFR109 TaxID=3448172 RepID=UPI003F777D68
MTEQPTLPEQYVTAVMRLGHPRWDAEEIAAALKDVRDAELERLRDELAETRAEALAYGFPKSRLDRADATGTSSHTGDGAWDDAGFIAEQRGWLRRDRLGDYAQLWLADRQGEAFDLLEPFEDETEVRR